MDETAALLSLIDRMLWVTALVAAPVLLACLAVGLVVGIIQAATSVNEQTLTFVPKILAMAGAAAFFIPWIATRMLEYAVQMFSQTSL